MCSKRHRKDLQKHSSFWESMVNKYEGRNYELEEKEYELQNRLDLLEKTAPNRVFHNMWRFIQNEPKHDFICHSRHRIRSRELFSRSRERFMRTRERNCKDDSPDRSRSPMQSRVPCDNFTRKKLKNLSNSENKMVLHQYIQTLEEDKGELTQQKHCMENMIKDLEGQLLEIKNTQIQQSAFSNNEEDNVSISSIEFELMRTVQELKERGIEMTKRIELMEKREAAYLETLKQADKICSEMEIGYKQHCYLAEQNEAEMRDRLQRLKKREESERRCCYGDSICRGKDKKCTKQDHCEDQKYWSMFNSIYSMLNRWN